MGNLKKDQLRSMPRKNLAALLSDATASVNKKDGKYTDEDVTLIMKVMKEQDEKLDAMKGIHNKPTKDPGEKKKKK